MSMLEGTVGILLVSQLRSLVEAEKFKGKNIDIYFGPGWISKYFCIKGDPEVIELLKRLLPDGDE